ncbi:hypothetical protein H4Q26_014631 [Puccinia striiformis f. sp. tritici PST-130]|nr:hypothetical protein H4Q26_014631 [Puccinia striiformis f. sp. tritici PST-130]
MFLTKVIWKVYLASGYIALIYQPAIRISEARPNILVRRQVTQPPNPGYLPMTGVRQPTTNGTPSPGLSGNANPTIDSSSGYATPAAPGLSTTGTGTSLSGYSTPGTGNGGYTNPSTINSSSGYATPAAPGLSTTGTNTPSSGYSTRGTGNGGYTNPSTIDSSSGYATPAAPGLSTTGTNTPSSGYSTPGTGNGGYTNPSTIDSYSGYTTPAAPGLSTTGTGTSLSGYSIPGTTNGNGGYTNPSTTYMTGEYGIPTSSSTFGRGTEASPTPGGAYIQSTPTSAPPGNVRAIGQNSTTPATPLNPSGTGGTGTSTSTTPATPQLNLPTLRLNLLTLRLNLPPLRSNLLSPHPNQNSSYGATKFDPKQPPETISCRNSDQLGYYCPISKCLKGKAKDTADKAPFSKFTFKKCNRLAAADLPAKGNIPEIHIFQYWAHQDGTITVRGYEDDASKDRHTYTCAAKSSNDNLVRPWCDACIFMDKPDEADPNPS